MVLAGLAALQKKSNLSRPVELTTEKVDETGALLKELYGLIQEDNVSAIKLVEDLTPLLSNTAYAEHLSSLSDALHDYDFSRAMELLQALVRELHIAL